MNKYFFLLVLVFWLTISISLSAVELTGDQIIKKVDQSFNAYSSDCKITMNLFTESGQERTRKIHLLSKGEEFAVIRFTEPHDIEGTAFLIRKEDEEEKMWLYMPALGNPRRIASHMKNGSFMGTDFTYKDISMISGNKYQDNYSSKLLGTEIFNDYECYLLETIPTDEEIEYSKMKMYVRKVDFIPLRLEFFNLDGELNKIMTNEKIEEVDEYMTPHKIVMENIINNTSTILELENIKYDIEIPDRLFTIRNLTRD